MSENWPFVLLCGCINTTADSKRTSLNYDLHISDESYSVYCKRRVTGAYSASTAFISTEWFTTRSSISEVWGAYKVGHLAVPPINLRRDSLAAIRVNRSNLYAVSVQIREPWGRTVYGSKQSRLANISALSCGHKYTYDTTNGSVTNATGTVR